MAKKKRKKISAKPVQKKAQPSLIQQYPVLSIVLLLFILLLIFYHQIVFQNMTLLPPDTLTSMSYQPFVKGAFEDGTFPLWNPYIFSGMPSYASLSSAPYVNIFDTILNETLNLVKKIIPLNDFFRLLINYLFFGLFVFLLMRSLKISPEASLFSAIAVIFIPQYIAFTAFGHNTKFLSLVLIPLIFWSVQKMLEKRNVLFFALTALVFGFQLLRAHIQVCYYTYLFIGIYFVYYSIVEYRETKKFNNIFKGFGLLTGTLILALMLSSVMYISVYEYSHYSIRGGGASGGLAYDYASNWSFSPAEMITFIVPSFFGFGGSTYWGTMPFTDYPLYMGIIVLFFAGLAFVLKRDKFLIFFAIIAVFSLIVSFGKFVPVLYGPMFNWLPFFNKFRVPSMIHILLDFSVVIMAGMGLHSLISIRETNDSQLIQKKYEGAKKYFYVFGSIGIAILLFIVIAKGTVIGWIANSGKVAETALQLPYQMALKDTVVMLILLGMSGFLALYYLNKKLNTNLLTIALIFFVIVDLWLVDYKIIDPKPAIDEKENFQKNEVVDFLENQPRPFRIFMAADIKPANWYMYYLIENVTGYHPAKLKNYQEFLEESALDLNVRFPYSGRPLPYFLSKYYTETIQNGKPEIQRFPAASITDERFRQDNKWLNMLNVKYLISYYPISDPRYPQRHTYVYQNSEVLPRAFFVNEVKQLGDKTEIFSFMKSSQFDPAKTAVLEEAPAFAIQPDSVNQVDLVSHEIHRIKLKASVASPALMVLSEIYYPAGWKAFVNGAETKIFKTNYILRSIFLQPGDQEIEFVYAPNSFRLGIIISSITLLLLILMLIFALKKRKKN